MIRFRVHDTGLAVAAGPSYRRLPVEIGLRADAEATAAELDEVFEPFVSLTVGALPYPMPRTARRSAGAPARAASP